MNNDRKLLELAAKAAGYEIQGKVEMMIAQHGIYSGGFVITNDKGGSSAWNPLTDDGDALRLAVKLGMMLDDITKGYMSGHVVAVSEGGTCYEPREADPYAATRRAIVRAAASIGETL